MWIRNQNRNNLIKICDHVGQINRRIEVNFDFLVGQYETVERALEVLDSIQEALSMGAITFEMPEK